MAPSLFGDQRVVVIKEIQDLDGDCSDEIGDYLENQDESLTLVLWHKGGVKGKALVDKIKTITPIATPINANIALIEINGFFLSNLKYFFTIKKKLNTVYGSIEIQKSGNYKPCFQKKPNYIKKLNYLYYNKNYHPIPCQ